MIGRRTERLALGSCCDGPLRHQTSYFIARRCLWYRSNECRRSGLLSQTNRLHPHAMAWSYPRRRSARILPPKLPGINTSPIGLLLDALGQIAHALAVRRLHHLVRHARLYARLIRVLLRPPEKAILSSATDRDCRLLLADRRASVLRPCRRAWSRAPRSRPRP